MGPVVTLKSVAVRVQRLPLLVLSAFVLSAGPAVADTFSYSDFSSTTGLTINGDAAQAGDVLRLVPSSDTQTGTAYRTTAVPFDGTTAFSTAFEFLVTSDDVGNVTDGFTFLLQNDGAEANALGAGGQGCGYAGLSPSVAVVFRGRNPSFIGVITDGVDPADLPVPFEPTGYAAFAEGAFYDTNQFVWIDYDPSSTLLSVYLNSISEKPSSPVMSTTVDIHWTLGSQAYVGFSAGNGGAYGSQDILNWTFSSGPATVSMSPIVSLLSGLKDVSNFTSSHTKFGFNLYNSPTDPPLYINSIDFIPGAGYDADIALASPGAVFQTNHGAYTLGTPIDPDTYFYLYDAVQRSGAVSPTVATGIYDFHLQIRGGEDAFSAYILQDIPYQIRIADGVNVSITEVTATPSTIHAGQTTTVGLTVTNSDLVETFVTTTWWYGGGGMQQGVNHLENAQFVGNWFNQSIAPGGSLTGDHTTWDATAATPFGDYSPSLGVVGGLYDGDQFGLAAPGDPLVTVGPGSGCNTPQADLNGDNSVDGGDYGLFAGCFNGTGNPINGGCECADLNGDTSVDGADYGLFAGCFNGTGNPSPCS